MSTCRRRRTGFGTSSATRAPNFRRNERLQMKTFTYHKPKTVGDAVALLSMNDASQPLAGGMTLLPTMKQRLAAPEEIVDLSAIAGLGGITLEAGTLVIGAMT